MPGTHKRFVLTGLPFLLNFRLDRPAAQTPDRYTYFPKFILNYSKEMENTPEVSFQDALKILTPKEINVLELVEKGYTNKEIAIRLGNSLRTIHSHRYNICDKLNITGANGLQKWLYKVKGTDF
jgi:DNA-binding NarL/FixJ family response regulator